MSLRAIGLRVAFGAREGLARIDLDVASGERFALLGPSGSGKTSLLRTLAGLVTPIAGVVRVDGADVTALPPERRAIVYMHQAPLLFPHLSALENVSFPLEVRGVSPAAARARASEWLTRVRLAGLGHRGPASLSGGERHRVALARALAAAPRVLLLDEPFASLDPELRDEVRDTVLEVLGGQRGTAGQDDPAVIVVTHDVDEAAALGDRVAVLLDGRIAQSGSATEVFSRPASTAVARFLGTTNLVAARRDAAGLVHSPFGSWRSPGVAAPLSLAIRPGHVRVVPAGAAHMATTPTDVLRAAATVDAMIERASGTVVRLRLPSREEQAEITLLAIVSGAPPRLGERVTMMIDAAAVHEIEGADAVPVVIDTRTGERDVR